MNARTTQRLLAHHCSPSLLTIPYRFPIKTIYTISFKTSTSEHVAEIKAPSQTRPVVPPLSQQTSTVSRNLLDRSNNSSSSSSEIEGVAAAGQGRGLRVPIFRYLQRQWCYVLRRGIGLGALQKRQRACHGREPRVAGLWERVVWIWPIGSARALQEDWEGEISKKGQSCCKLRPCSKMHPRGLPWETQCSIFKSKRMRTAASPKWPP